MEHTQKVGIEQRGMCSNVSGAAWWDGEAWLS